MQWRGVRWVPLIAVLSIAAGCSSNSSVGSPSSTASTLASASAGPSLADAQPVEDPTIPGIGATRHDWNASHIPNPNFNNGMVYGYDPSLPSYLANSGAIYWDVQDLAGDRISTYHLNMHPVDRDNALVRVRQELPSDATVAWDLRLDQCYRVAFTSARLDAVGHYMAEVELQHIQEDGAPATSPRAFNQALFDLNSTGSPPDPSLPC